jgi:hypothetical protein
MHFEQPQTGFFCGRNSAASSGKIGIDKKSLRKKRQRRVCEPDINGPIESKNMSLQVG